jgi:phosphoserine phosphatase RsbU/P
MAEIEEQIASLARADAPRIVLGVVVTVLGLAAIAAHLFRRRGKDLALLWFGIFSTLYGSRLLIQTELVVLAIGIPAVSHLYVTAAVNYVVPIFASLYLIEIFPNWRRLFRWVAVVQAIFAVSGIICDQAFKRPFALDTLNNILVIVFILLGDVLLVFRAGPGVDVNFLRAGFLIYSVTVIVDNFGGLIRRHPDIEPFGFAIFLVCLGTVVIRRSLRTQERLTAIEEELNVARRIQTSILPRELPISVSFSIAVRYLPMTSVAGDFYDLLVLDQNRLGILVADVTGHGVPAALIASMVKIASAAQLAHADDPAIVLRGMNQILCPNTQGQFVTAAYLFFDFEHGTLRYAAAAHPRMQWLHRYTREVEGIEQNGLLMGVMPAVSYTAVERSFRSGDRFFLFTDGLLEAVNEQDEFFGEDRLRRCILESAGLDTGQAADYLLAELSNWAGYKRGRSQDDDLTLLVIDVAATADR